MPLVQGPAWLQLGVSVLLVVVIGYVIRYLAKRDREDREERRDVRTWQGNHMTRMADQIAVSADINKRASDAVTQLACEQRKTIQTMIQKCPGPQKPETDP